MIVKIFYCNWENDCCSLHAVTSSVRDLLHYTHTEKCYLFVLYNRNWNGLLKDEKRKLQVCWRDLTWIWRHLCVCPLIDHGQQPMKCTQKSRYCINQYIHYRYILFTSFSAHNLSFSSVKKATYFVPFYVLSLPSRAMSTIPSG